MCVCVCVCVCVYLNTSISAGLNHPVPGILI